MNPASRLLRRLRGRSPAELRDRLRQAAMAAAERSPVAARLGLNELSLDRLLARGMPPDPAAILARFREGGSDHPLPGLADPAATAAVVSQRWPDEAASCLARAERIAAGRFDLLGHRNLDFGSPIDWQLDPIAGLRAPLVHWSRVPYLDTAVVGDHKVVWELNRHQWLATLGQAYALTGDERWAQQAVRHIESWIDANPPKLGINWASSLEVAFRAMSWLVALQFLRRSPALEPAFLARILESLHVHGRHLETYLSTWFSPNTHLTGEALGLFHLGTLLPELAAATRWQRLGLDILEAQLPIQVRPDGVYFEQATQYHRYTTEFYTHLVLLAEANGVELAPHVRPTLALLYEHLLHLARPDGTIPLFGDDDGGRLVQLDDRTPDDVRSLLATGAAILGRPDLAFGARGDLAGMTWLLGPEGLRRFEALTPQPPAVRARAFHDGGYYVSRDDWSPRSNWLAVDVGPHGAMNCGHAHADALAFELAVAGRPVLVDAGTFSYSGSERTTFRHGAAHNTVTLDGRSSSEPAGPFQWARVAGTRLRHWHAAPGAVYLSGCHDGFMALPDPASCSREILHLTGGCVVVRDRVASPGRHRMAARFHCAPGVEARVEGSAAVVRLDGEDLLQLAVFGHEGRLAAEEAWVSRQYGSRERAPVVEWQQEDVGPQEVVSILLPGPAGEPVCELAGVAAGRAFSIPHRGAAGLLLVGDGGTIAADGVEADARWLWLRRGASGRASEYVAIDATFARVAGEQLWTPGERLDWRVGAESPGDAAASSVGGPSPLADTGSGAT